jgi:hypothetical protein
VAEVWLRTVFASALLGGGWSASFPGRFAPEDKTRYAPGPVWARLWERASAPAGHGTAVIHTVAWSPY